MIAADRLVKVPRADWPTLRDLYRHEWPKHFQGYQNVNAFIRWTRQRPDITDLNLYSLNGDWSDGTFVIVHRYQVFMNTLNATTERLGTAFDLLDHNESFNSLMLMEDHLPAIQRVLSAKDLSDVEEKTSLFYLPHEKAAAIIFECPAGITLATLNEEHAITVNSAWPYGRPYSLPTIQRLIALNPNVGAFDVNGTLVAWCLRNLGGSLAALHVDKDHVRRGLGTLVCLALTKKLGEMGEDVSASVGLPNGPARRLFQRIGFEEVGVNYYLHNKTDDTVKIKWSKT